MLQSVPHAMPVARERGKSPGNGISAPLFSEDPMAMEEEFYRGMERDRRLTALSVRGDVRARRERGEELGLGLADPPDLLSGPDALDAGLPDPPPTGSPQTDDLIGALGAAEGGGTFGDTFTR